MFTFAHGGLCSGDLSEIGYHFLDTMDEAEKLEAGRKEKELARRAGLMSAVEGKGRAS